MKVQYRIGRSVVEAEGKDIKDIFSQLSGAAEVFGFSICGACRGENVAPSVREVQGNTYYELRCRDCGATLAFGQRKADGQLYPKRKDKDGNWLEHGGWVKFQKRTEEVPF